VPAYVAPCLPFGVADYFGSAPGGLALTAASFRCVLTDLLAALLRHGLTRIIILNGHSGNAPVIHEVTLDVRRAEGITIPSLTLWKIAKDLMTPRLGIDEAARFGHGAEPLLSLNLALRGASLSQPAPPVPADSYALGLRVGGFGTLDFNGIAINAPVEFDQAPRDAISAAAPGASAALGAAVAADVVRIAADFVVYFAGYTADAL
jgi:creatinine amidohydrolase